ncbi:uncharacterized protein LOC115883419 isoform X1 [Sitophilus oryzae]|uniref:Uncharacterized protein LOC115883419 isoform X1 n=1 Tax=Sitophilus oryzae TaxID=7048 RepID=A0A6J2Y1I2_SITOR|nr:uncharacterized protein LOC115883419 isoform X1 [Sitophilus oryzae]
MKMSTLSSKHAKKKENTYFLQSCSKVVLLLCLAAFLRYLVMSSKYQTIIANHFEISTPICSWKRVQEGLFLLSRNIDPYDGDLLHETPTALIFYKIMSQNVFRDVSLMFIFFDIGTALLLYAATRHYAKQFHQEHRDRTKYPKDVHEYLPSEGYYEKVPLYVLVAFLFNPYTFLGCVGYSTAGIHNFFLALFVFGMVYGSPIVSSLALAICSSVSFYPLILLSPLYIYYSQVYKSKTKALLVVLYFLTYVYLITFYNNSLSKSFKFINNVYGSIWTVPDLQPNIGLFWYFFTEVFDHFRELFIHSFQINATILYLVPLSIKFSNRPFILTIALLFLITIFKSYPCLSDLGFVLSFLPNFLHLYAFCQQGVIVGVILFMTSCLAPTLWHLWIYSASANANFYFGVTLAYAIAQIFLVTDILFAQTKWEFTLKHGREAKIDGEDADLSLE